LSPSPRIWLALAASVYTSKRHGENGGKMGGGKWGQTTFSTFYRIAVMLKKVVCPRFPVPFSCRFLAASGFSRPDVMSFRSRSRSRSRSSCAGWVVPWGIRRQWPTVFLPGKARRSRALRWHHLPGRPKRASTPTGSHGWSRSACGRGASAHATVNPYILRRQYWLGL
jgi:hypothetical protein